MTHVRFVTLVTLLSVPLSGAPAEQSSQITTAGQPAQLDIRAAGDRTIRITLKPVSFKNDFPATPAVVDRKYTAAALSLREIAKPVQRTVGSLNVEVRPNPLTVSVRNARGQLVQELIFDVDGKLLWELSGTSGLVSQTIDQTHDPQFQGRMALLLTPPPACVNLFA